MEENPLHFNFSVQKYLSVSYIQLLIHQPTFPRATIKRNQLLKCCSSYVLNNMF